MSALRFFTGPMGAGKSTLALQMLHNYETAGRHGMLLTSGDRAGAGLVSSRLGLCRDAVEVAPGVDLYATVVDHLGRGTGPGTRFVVADEAQFYSREQVDQLARLVDEAGVDVDCFGISTDFTSTLFPGTARLIELADSVHQLQLDVLCWCGAVGQQNARVVDGEVVHYGDQVLVGDVASSEGSGGAAPAVFYVVLCRRHWRAKDRGPSVS